MNTRRFYLTFGLLVLGSQLAHAQTTTPTTTTTTTPTTTTNTTTSNTNTNGATQAQQGLQGDTVTLGTLQAPKITILSTNSGNGTATGTPSDKNSFVNWYGDYLSMGQPSKYINGPPQKATATFGKGIYTTTTTTTQGGGGRGGGTQQNATGFTTIGTPRAPAYSTRLSDDLPVISHSATELQNSVREMLDRSDFVKNKSGINVSVSGTTIELTGTVATDRERRIIEGMVRAEPGVRQVQNLLQVSPTK